MGCSKAGPTRVQEPTQKATEPPNMDASPGRALHLLASWTPWCYSPIAGTQDRWARHKQGLIFLLSLVLEENMAITPLGRNNPTANLPLPQDSLLKLVKGCRRCAGCLIRVISTGLLLLTRGSITLLSPMILKHNILPHSYLPTYSIYIK